MAETTVKVVVRCRPLLPHETDKDVKNVSTIDEDGGRITISGRTHDYGNESVVGGGDRHATMYERTAKPLIAQLFDGYNATVLAYGQTGSGKTHTMLGDPEPENRGIMYRACEQLFASIESCEKAGWKYSVNIQIVEVYNEKLRDLLNHATDSAQELELAARTDPTTGAVYVENLSTHSVSAAEDAVAMLQQALTILVVWNETENERNSA